MGFTRAPETRPTPPEVYNYRIYLLSCLACLGSWMFGYQNGVIAGVLVLPSFFADFNLPPVGSASYNYITATIVSLLQIGGLIGALATFPAMKFWGRRIALACAGAVYFIGAAVQTFSKGDVGMLYAGRLITGIGTGSATVIVPLYIAEISPPSIRGSLVGLYEINNQLSSLLGYWSNYIVNAYIPSTASRQWRIPLAMQMIPSALILLAAIFILPESPRFLVKKGDAVKARNVLAYVRHLDEGHEYINGEMEEIEEVIQRENESAEGKAWWGLLRELGWKGNRMRVLIGVGLMFGQNMTGIQGVNFYTPTIFETIGFGGTKVVLLASGMFAVVKTISTILSLVFFIDRTGRRKLLIISSIGTSAALWYIGGFVTAAHVDAAHPQGKSVAGWIAIVCVYVYALSFSIAWNGVVWVYVAEIFPTRIKELAVCICTSTQWLSQFAVARATPTMITHLKGGFFFFFAAMIVVMGLGVWFVVPETKGRTLEAMDLVFGTAYGDAVEVELREYREGVVKERRDGEEEGVVGVIDVGLVGP